MEGRSGWMMGVGSSPSSPPYKRVMSVGPCWINASSSADHLVSFDNEDHTQAAQACQYTAARTDRRWKHSYELLAASRRSSHEGAAAASSFFARQPEAGSRAQMRGASEHPLQLNAGHVRAVRSQAALVWSAGVC
jgi:hypothetical protein